MAIDERAAARAVLDAVGGPENVVSAAHCATRLRLVLKDDSRADRAAAEAVPGVKGVFAAQGQLQIIFGTGIVDRVTEAFLEAAHLGHESKKDVKAAAAGKQNILLRAIKTIGDVFVPIIPAIVASGLLMGLLEGLGRAVPSLADSGFFTLLNLFSNAAFTFLPILIAVSAAKAFGGNPYLGAVIGMIMIHPNLVNAWSAAEAAVPQIPVWFGLYSVPAVGYQGHVIPVVLAVFFMSRLERFLHKIVPAMIDLFVTPLTSVLVTGYVTLSVIGPVFARLETWVLGGVEWLITIPFGIGAFLMGGLYALTVVTGVHHMYNVIEAGMLSSVGLNTWMPIASAANVAQGAAALAVALRAKRKKTKAMALPASLSAFLGITEPAIFGVNIRYLRPFAAGAVGGACGALVSSLFGVGATAYGVTGVFGFLITTEYAFGYLISLVTAAVVGFAVSWLLGFREEPDGETMA
ncbi:MAG: PTS transporter subunit EIIC [Clostridia bacterium]|nr:PTS transporter subunit EIIC [Clostridia bacterium]